MEKITAGEIYLKIINDDEIDWDKISREFQCDDEIIEEFHDKLCWFGLCKYQKLSENIIDKYINRIEWLIFSIYQKLTFSMIEKYKNKLSWFWILINNKYEEDFLWVYREYLPDIKTISLNSYISREFVKKLRDWREENGTDLS